MIIDFHTHVFPQKIASRAVEKLTLGGEIPAFSDGTTDGLLMEMERAGTTLSVALPVLTSPTQFDSVNAFALAVNREYQGKILSFAGIHPDCDNIEGKMKFLADSGFKGVKIHPDYQGKFITDDKYLKILQCAKALDLVVVTHAGVDAGFRDCPVRCTPALALEAINAVPDVKLVLAHLGGNEMLLEVENLLCGADVFLDTSLVTSYDSPEIINRIISKHGADKILFASDSPWNSVKKDVEIISSLNLTSHEKDLIFYKNAQKLLKI